MILHVSQKRFDNLLSQSYQLEYNPEKLKFLPPARPGDNTYHFLSGECGRCDSCDADFESLVFDTPADLETLKMQMKE